MILKYKLPNGSKLYRPVIFGRPTARSFRTRTACEAYRDRFINTYVRLIPKAKDPVTLEEIVFGPLEMIHRFFAWCRDIMGWA